MRAVDEAALGAVVADANGDIIVVGASFVLRATP